MNEPISTSQLLIHGSIALFGAIVHAAKAHRNGDSKTWVDFILLTVMSSFSGVMFALIGLNFFPEQVYLTMAMAGTGGFLGVEGMAIIIEKVKGLIK